MAYQTYSTEAVVCGTKTSNTSDMLFTLFTREAGMIFVQAKSVREEKSKHRYSLQPFAHTRVTLVQGKSGWKITGTEPIRNLYSESENREARALWRNIVLFLRRVLQGETAYPDIFDDLLEVYRHAQKVPREILEQVFYLRTLHTLGYVAPLQQYEELLNKKFSYGDATLVTTAVQKKCREVTDYALAQSQL